MPEKKTRREIAKTAAVASVGWTIIRPGSVKGTPANDRVKIGLLGAGRRGTNVGGFFVKHDGAEMAALADIYDDQLETAQDRLPAKDAKVYKSAKAILDSDIDAIYIATPPYLHPEHLELAVESGKHILLEKPVAVDPAGIRRVMAAARNVKPGRMVIVDFQQRFGKDYREAYERVSSGEIGKIGMVRTAWIGGDLPRRDGHAGSEEQVRNWLFYKERSGDIIVEQNCHNIDVAHWFTGVNPVSVSGFGHRAIRTDIGDIVDTFGITYKLSDGRVYSHAGNQICPRGYRDVGEYFFGEKGVVHTSRQGYEVYVEGREPVAVKTEYNLNADVVDHFLKGVRGEIPTENRLVEAAESTLTAIMGRIAYEQERVVTWDEALNM